MFMMRAAIFVLIEIAAKTRQKCSGDHTLLRNAEKLSCFTAATNATLRFT
jgi:hypothetical protein